MDNWWIMDEWWMNNGWMMDEWWMNDRWMDGWIIDEWYYIQTWKCELTSKQLSWIGVQVQPLGSNISGLMNDRWTDGWIDWHVWMDVNWGLIKKLIRDWCADVHEWMAQNRDASVVEVVYGWKDRWMNELMDWFKDRLCGLVNEQMDLQVGEWICAHTNALI